MEGEKTATVTQRCAQGSRHYCKLSDVKPDAAFNWTDAARSKRGGFVLLGEFCCCGAC